MPYASKLIDDGRLICVTGVGECTSEAELELWRDQLCEDRIPGEYDLLVDLTHVEAVGQRHPDARIETERVVSRLPQRLAIATKDWDEWSDNTIWADLTEQLARNAIVFFDIHIAGIWLGVDDSRRGLREIS